MARAGSAATKGVQSIATTPKQLMDRINRELYKRNAELIARNKTLALLRSLDEVSLSITETVTMTQRMADAIAAQLGYDMVAIAIFDEKCVCLRWIALSSPLEWVSSVIKDAKVKNVEIPLSSNAAPIRALNTKETLFVENSEEIFPEEFSQQLMKAALEHKHPLIQNTLVQPLRYSDSALGLLVLSSSRSLKHLSKYEEETIVGIIGLISLAYYKAKIYEDLQETSAQLAAANKQLKDLDKAKSEFLSIASHQLYTPLTALRGYISMLQEGDFGQMTDQQKSILDILSKSALRLIELIKNLLDISRIESGRLELNLESADIVNMARELVQDLLPNAHTKKLGLEFHAPAETMPHAVVDQQRVRQVMLNFIDNAIKYTPSGRIDVFVEKEGDEIIFRVTDTGKGITEEEVTKLFNKFARVGGASRFHTEGTGLGLYVAKQIVTEHRGDVKAQSLGTGKGSTFTMKIPVEGTAKSLKVGEKATVVIKAAEA